MASLPLPFVLATGNPDKALEINEIFVAHIDEPIVAWALTFGADTTDTCSTGPAGSKRRWIASPPRTLSTRCPTSRRPGRRSRRTPGSRRRRSAARRACSPIADDTGLEVDALDGAPGIYAARYAGRDATYADNVRKLLRELEGVYPTLRTARFATVAMACWPDGRELAVRGEVEGVIAATESGESGFGYDPVFVPTEGDGRTFAQMTAAEKHAISHRGRAFAKLAQALSI